MAEFSSRVVPTLRFAPSPNGRLHLGHALSALTNRRIADSLGGRLLLRIEDIDPQRCRPEFEASIRADLDWLGLRFDGAIRRQSEHLPDYAWALDRLRGLGVVYPCFCSRQQIRTAAGAQAPLDPDGAPLYPGTCRALGAAEARVLTEAGAPHVLRLAMEKALALLPEPVRYRVFDEAGVVSEVAAQPGRWGDVVLARREVPTSYHLSVVVDDALQGVTHVVRGRDLEAATDIHAMLQLLLGLPAPLYHFHALLTDETGQKLAKSRQSQSLADLRAAGATPASIRAGLGLG